MVPFLAVLVAAVLSWNHILGWSDLVVFAVMYLVVGIGVTVGYHRLLTHRSFATYKPIAYGLAVAGTMSVQGPVMIWSPITASITPTPTRRATRIRRTGHGTGLRRHVAWAVVGAHGLALARSRASASVLRGTPASVVEDPRPASGSSRQSPSHRWPSGLLIPFGLGFALHRQVWSAP